MATSALENFANSFETPLQNFINQSVEQISFAVSKPLLLGGTFYLVIFGIMVAYGYIRSPLQDFVLIIFKLCFIYYLVREAEGFHAYITNIFYEGIPESLGSIFIQASGNNIDIHSLTSGKMFDVIINKGINIGGMIYKGAGFTEVGIILVGVFVMIFSSIFSFVSFAIVLYAKLGLALVIALGPVFISLALFKQTRSFTQSWVAALLNFTLLQILIYGLLGIILSFIEIYFLKMGAEAAEPFVGGIVLIGLFFLSLYLSFQLPSIAASLAGSGFAVGERLVARLGGGAAQQMSVAGQMARSGAYRRVQVASDKIRQLPRQLSQRTNHIRKVS